MKRKKPESRQRSEPRISEFESDADSSADDMFSQATNYSQPQYETSNTRRRRGGDKTGIYAFVSFIIIAVGITAWIGWKEGWIFTGKPPTAVEIDKNKHSGVADHGSMNIVSDPAGAAIYIDGREVGKSPYHASSLKPGSYVIRLELKGRLNWQQNVEVKAGQLKKLEANLKSSLFKLAITSNAPHAEYQILGMRKKFTQGMVLEPGKYKIRAWAPGFKVATKEVIIFDKNERIGMSLEEATRFFPLKVKINPSQATDLAEIRIVHWPAKFKQGLKVSSGTYTLEVKAKGYRVATKKFKMVNKANSVTIKLKSGGVRLTVKTKPTSAKVKILPGPYKYKAGIKVMPGKYKLQVSAKGFATRTQTVIITNNKTYKINLKEDIYLIALNTTPRNVKTSIKFIKPSGLKYSKTTKYPPGEYKIQVRAQGYKTVVKTINIKKSGQTLKIQLAKLVFPFQIKTVPARAKVRFLNKKFSYKAGLKVAPGKYHVAVSAKGFRTKKVWLTVSTKAINKKINLGADKYTLAVNVQPSNAIVKIVSPRINWKPGVKLKPGRYKIEIRAPGYKVKRQTITVKDKDVNLNFRLGEEAYSLTVKTTPEESVVKLIDHPVDYSPGMTLIPGRYEVEVSSKGYAPVKQWVTIIDKDETIFVVMKERLLLLTVTASPSTAKVELVDYSKEYHPNMELPAGTYKVKVSLKNYKTVIKPIQLQGQNASLTIKLSLKTILKPEHPGEPTMIVLRQGRYQMGSLSREYGRSSNEGPEHTVVFVKAFAIAQTEVTFSQYSVFAKASNRNLPSDSGWGRGNRPVINVSWHDAKAYASWLSQKTGKKYRLPSEAEWEYAARAGSRKPYSTGLCATSRQANFDGEYAYRGCLKGINRGKTVAVKSFPANRFKVYEMHGNVAEWTGDCWSSSHQGAPQSGRVRTNGRCSKRVIKGGGWSSIPRDIRSASRGAKSTSTRKNSIGFRVVREL
ncbi:Protein of unknown function DUF323 [hydrothermal vent metagenome]|uniref:Serine/threonine kinase n=1 Tax=hydrothermal vent metagenome TaxID=652676 RepID=A0A3B0YAC6_9ZZZZ